MEKPRVLFLHTYEDAARLVKMSLERHGFDVHTSSDPHLDIARLLAESRPDVFVVEPFLAPNSYYLAAGEKLHVVPDPYSAYVPRGVEVLKRARQAMPALRIILYSRYNFGEFAEPERAAIKGLSLHAIIEEHEPELALLAAIHACLAIDPALRAADDQAQSGKSCLLVA